ncbi:DDHD domain-containing protein [Gilbertella persicaria]|uniref:DDHD domain-containing protein n=1 Tax=Gilbertella persicaria TaxID=101096 RepID=UPI00221FC4D5|nr:DDHD domain-containing protein [Gilbertella persicaria]KAI8090972.1 DDHD domain-containing protein [Gilbertella persicaria]
MHYIPIEWHKHIHQETDQAMDNITLNSIPFMRMINNDYLADAFFYLSKERGQSIIQHVTQTFNRAYLEFMQIHPNFNGKIAILAYSLGGIITWDILSNQTRPGLTRQRIESYSKLDLEFPTLAFKPDYLFAVGSPLSAFLTVRSQDPRLYKPDPSIIFENVFHPFDPLAYRFEPMLNSEYKHQPAVLVEQSVPQFVFQDQARQVWTKSLDLIACVSRPFCQDKETQNTSVLATLKRCFSYSFGFHPSFEVCHEQEDEKLESGKKRRFEDLLDGARKRKRENELLETTVTRGIKHKDNSDTCHEFLPRRIDYVLRPERFLGVAKNKYVSGLTAHFCYWTHNDLMWHMVCQLDGISSEAN